MSPVKGHWHTHKDWDLNDLVSDIVGNIAANPAGAIGGAATIVTNGAIGDKRVALGRVAGAGVAWVRGGEFGGAAVAACVLPLGAVVHVFAEIRVEEAIDATLIIEKLGHGTLALVGKEMEGGHVTLVTAP